MDKIWIACDCGDLGPEPDFSAGYYGELDAMHKHCASCKGHRTIFIIGWEYAGIYRTQKTPSKGGLPNSEA